MKNTQFNSSEHTNRMNTWICCESKYNGCLRTKKVIQSDVQLYLSDIFNYLLLTLLYILPLVYPHFTVYSKGLEFNKLKQNHVQVGADRLFSEYTHLINGKTLALVSNHTGRLSNGTHLADTLYNYPHAELKVLFGMYQNIRILDYSVPRDAQKAIDKETGLVKYSLYFDIHKPTPEMLSNIDLIIFDIQEVGVRFFEHINILGFVMEAAAENDIEIVVLDRPNPITGLHMDGFVTDDDFLYRFSSFGKLPVVHGMTIGEIAKLYNGEHMLREWKTAKLHVVELKGWKRSMWYDETGREWQKPSPNLITLESVIAYAGTCLFEGLNISEGRGTDKPFEYIGAPWVEHYKVSDILNELKLPGVTFKPVEFIPQRKPFHGRDPLFSGELCYGIFVNITGRDQIEPFKIGIAMLWAFNKIHENEIKWTESIIDKHSGTKRLLSMIKDSKQPYEIFDSWKKELLQFKEIRPNYLIYE